MNRERGGPWPGEMQMRGKVAKRPKLACDLDHVAYLFQSRRVLYVTASELLGPLGVHARVESISSLWNPGYRPASARLSTNLYDL
jgi:hypothetical protein